MVINYNMFKSINEIKIAAIIVLITANLMAANAVCGVVKNSKTKKPVVGANIELTGTQRGAISDEKGKFCIDISASLPITLKITHISYINQEIEVTDISEMEILLVPDVIQGEEVFVIGTPPTYQLDVLVPVDVLDIDDIELQGARDMEGALRRVPSLDMVTTSSGKQTVSIRGSNPTDVAVYLDGVKINDSNKGIADLSFIDFNTIEQIQIIKGGGSILFGSGSLGGVVNLESKQALTNSFAYTQGQGFTFDDDVDLSLSGSVIYKKVGVGARYSGSSRKYGGRTTTSTIFKNIYSTTQIPWGLLDLRWNELNKTLMFPSGNLETADKLSLLSFQYRGRMGKFPGWNIFIGKRQWNLVQDFYTSLNEELKDGSDILKISKLITMGPFESTAQLESEKQYFLGEKSYFDITGQPSVNYKSRLDRIDNGFALSSRLVFDGEHPNIDFIRFEFGYRLDYFTTTQRQWFEFPLAEIIGEDLIYKVPGADYLKTIISRRIGMHLEGNGSDLKYIFFVGQGNNGRLPTLGDYFHFQNTALDSLVDSTLVMEDLGSTDMNLNLIFSNIRTQIPIDEIKVTLNLFLNDYTNKIAYRIIEDNSPVPYNSKIADIRGYEGSISCDMFKEHIMLMATGTYIDVSNPVVFPFKPEYRVVFVGAVNWKWLNLSFDHLNEGKQYYYIPNIGEGFRNARENANLSVSIRKNFLGLNWSLTYTWRNLMSADDNNLSLEESLRQGFNYFEKYREIATIRVEL